MLQSRWESEEGPKGLWQGILEVMDAFVEHRMAADYGDYLAVTVNEYRGPNLSWTGVEWTKVAEMMEAEEEKLRIWRSKKDRPAMPLTPVLDDIRKAAAKKQIPSPQVAFEIREYAKRNDQCHSGIKELIHNAKWQQLADIIVRDKQTLGRVYQHDPHAQQGMQQCILNLQKKWFETLYCDGDGDVCYVPSEEAIAKTKARQPSSRRVVGGQWSLGNQGALQANPVVNGVGAIVQQPPVV
ncbi:MAG: hypothetical protein Q9207_005121 [Kuettlingeria erythrocarpa]